MTEDLSADAQLLLLIFAANGGAMTKADAQREFLRVKAMTADDRAQWEATVKPLARAHAFRVLGGDDFL